MKLRSTRWPRPRKSCDLDPPTSIVLAKTGRVCDEGQFRRTSAAALIAPPGLRPIGMSMSALRTWLNKAPETPFASMLLRQGFAVAFVRFDPDGGVDMRRHGVELGQIASAISVCGRTRAIENVVEQRAIEDRRL